MARVKRPKTYGGIPTSAHLASKRGGGTDLGYDFLSWNGPPPGTYDPGIYAQVRSGQRGLLDLIEQQEREEKRQGQDVGQKTRELRLGNRQGHEDIGRQRGYTQADNAYQLGRLGIDFTRDITDLSTARLRGEENYARTLTDLQHRYGSAAERQVQDAVQQGTAEAGTAEASAAVRGANQRYDKSGIDLSHARDLEDLASREGRIREDYGSNVGRAGDLLARALGGYDTQGNRLTQDTKRGVNALHLAALRSKQDRTTKLSNTKREQGIYEQDAAQQAYFQAHQLNPSIVFPGGAPSGARTGGPNTHPTPPAIGGAHALGIGRSPRSTNGGIQAPRYGRRPRLRY